MKRILLLVCGLMFLFSNAAEARLLRRSSGGTVSAVPAGHSTSTAQGVAQIMAATGRVGHWGGHTAYEGCGSGSTPNAAYNNCCYANSGLTTVDVGYARGANGMWYCCRRYR